MRRGSTDSNTGNKGSVSNIQTVLKSLGYYNGEIDGSYGPQTEAAVKAYQKDNGLTYDGMAGPQTLASLNSKITANAAGTKNTESAASGSNAVSTGTSIKVSDFDRDLSVEDQQRIASIRNELSAGRINGDEANRLANEVRSKYGYSVDKQGNRTELAKLNLTPKGEEIVKEIQIYKRVEDHDENGYVTNVRYELVPGYLTKDANGIQHSRYEDGSELGNGDAVYFDSTGWLYYDTNQGKGVTQQTWEMMNPIEEAPQQASGMSAEELEAYINDLLFDSGTTPTELEDFLTWAEARALGEERYNSMYDQALGQANEDIDKRALQSGFYGQLPTEALKQRTAAEMESQKLANIIDYARDLMGEDRDAALAKFNADLAAKQVDEDSLMNLLNLFYTYQENGQGGTSGMNNGGSGGVSFVYPSGESYGQTLNASGATATVPATATGSNNKSYTGSQGTASKGYDNGGLTDTQVRLLQNAISNATGQRLELDGKYGPATKAAAGGLTAQQAYDRYVNKSGASDAATKGLSQSDYDRVVNRINYNAGIGNNGGVQAVVDAYYDGMNSTQKANVDSLLRKLDLI